MEASQNNQNARESHEEETKAMLSQQEDQEEIEELKQSLPKTKWLGGKSELVSYQGFWLAPYLLPFILSFQRHFRARDSDLIIAGMPKTGNTWLKALLYAVVNRKNIGSDTTDSITMLTKKNPHELVYYLEGVVYGDTFDYPRPRDLDELPSPRLLHTHLPWGSLPASIRDSGCRVLYIARNPLDAYVSHMHFSAKVMRRRMSGGEGGGVRDPRVMEPGAMEEYFKECYEGRTMFGPFLDHVVGYWRLSLEQPNKVLFLRYEDLKDDPSLQLRRIAEFVSFPFSPLEEGGGVVKDVVRLCSFENLKELEVNKRGTINKFFDKASFFRKGGVGDWTNYFTPSMGENMNKLMQEKLDGTGLSFKLL